MATNELHAILRGKSAIVIMALSSTDRFKDIEVEGDVENGQQKEQKLYSVQLLVADIVITKSTHTKPRSSVLKWEWKANNHMWDTVLWLTYRSTFTFWKQLLRAVINDES